MERKDAIKHLLELLRESSFDGTDGFEATLGAQYTLVICRNGHWRGMWQFANGQYGWVTAGSREPLFETDDVNAAVSYSIERIFAA